MFRFLSVASLASCAAAAPTIFEYKQQLVPMFSNGRIIGGEPTTIEDYPWQISLQYYGSHRCGGSIIRATSLIRILTAAHCTDGISAQFLSIRAGSTYRGSGGVVITVSSIAQHDSYNPTAIDNDIAVLRLNSPLEVGKLIQPIPLPNQGYIVPVPSSAQVTGWGVTSEGGGLPSILQVVTVPITLNADCQLAYPSLITDGMLCAGYLLGVKDACQGDSGGPLVVGNLLQGIVSWGIGCAQPGHPGVYTRVAHFRNWIDNVG